MDFYNYTYLHANGYLDKFRHYFHNPELTVNGLNAILKEFFKRRGLRLFKDNSGKGNIYAKQDLNFILENPFFCSGTFNNIFKDWNKSKIEKEWEKEPQTKADFRGEDDMEHQIRTLGINEKKNPKNIFITEAQLGYIKENSVKTEEYFVEPEKVKIVKKYLDNNFKKGGIAALGEDGYPKTIPIVALKGTDGQVVRNMSDKQLFAMLLDKFGKIYSDMGKVKKFLRQIMKDWYYDKISKEGLLSVNKY